MTTPTREIHLASRPVGWPTHDDFRVVETELADPGPGEVLVRNTFMSVDPYMRGRMNDRRSYVPPFRLDAPLEGGEPSFVGNTEHSALGTRWVYDAWGDPVWQAAVEATIRSGGTQAVEEVEGAGIRLPSAIVQGNGGDGSIVRWIATALVISSRCARRSTISSANRRNACVKSTSSGRGASRSWSRRRSKVRSRSACSACE